MMRGFNLNEELISASNIIGRPVYGELFKDGFRTGIHIYCYIGKRKAQIEYVFTELETIIPENMERRFYLLIDDLKVFLKRENVTL